MAIKKWRQLTVLLLHKFYTFIVLMLVCLLFGLFKDDFISHANKSLYRRACVYQCSFFCECSSKWAQYVMCYIVLVNPNSGLFSEPAPFQKASNQDQTHDPWWFTRPVLLPLSNGASPDGYYSCVIKNSLWVSITIIDTPMGLGRQPETSLQIHQWFEEKVKS